MKTPHYSLTLYISGLFMLLATIIGSVLIVISYQHAKELMSEVAKKTSHDNSHKVEAIFKRTIAPTLTILDLMASNDTITPEHAITDKSWLSFNRLVFNKNPNLVALFFGDDSGSFTLFRPMISDSMRQHFNAPNDAALFINHTEVNGLNQTHFLDDRLNPLHDQQSQDNQYDPRIRPWYTSAATDGQIRVTNPYLFYFMKTTGVTLSRKMVNGKGVVGADFTLDSLSKQIAIIGTESNSKLILFDQRFNVLAQHNTNIDLTLKRGEIAQQLEHSLFSAIINRISSQVIYETAQDSDQEWSVTLTPVQVDSNLTLLLAEATPRVQLISGLLSMRDKQVSVAIGLLLVSFIGIFFITKRLTAPLNLLINSTDRISKFDFKKSIYPKSNIREVAQLTRSLQFMEHTLFDVLQLLRETASNQDFTLLANTIAKQSYLITRAETIVLFMLDSNKNQFELTTNHSIIPFKIDLTDLLSDTPWLRSQLNKGETVHITKSDNIIKKYQEHFFNSDLYLFPLLTPKKELIGVLNLGYERAISDEQRDKHSFILELLNFAELVKQNIDHIQQQQQLFDGFLEEIAKAVDIKESNSTGYYQQAPLLAARLLHQVTTDTTYFPYIKSLTHIDNDLKLATELLQCSRIALPQPRPIKQDPTVELATSSVSPDTLNDERFAQISQHFRFTQKLISFLPHTDPLIRVAAIVSRLEQTANKGVDYMHSDNNELHITADALWITDIFIKLMQGKAPYQEKLTLEESLAVMTNMAINSQLSPRLYLLFLKNDIDLIYVHQFAAETDHISVEKAIHISTVKQYLRTLI
jgi:hypothetical protein